jgi:hypothetical protein
LIRRERSQLDATQWFIELIIRSSCLRSYYAHRQELETIQHVAHNTLFKAGCVVWCGAIGYASGLKDVALL